MGLSLETLYFICTLVCEIYNTTSGHCLNIADINKALLAKRKRLEMYTKASLKTSNQKIECVWKTQQEQRYDLYFIFLREISAGFAPCLPLSPTQLKEHLFLILSCLFKMFFYKPCSLCPYPHR